MNRNTIEVFKALMKKGWIDRQDDSLIWGHLEDTQVIEEIEEFKAVIGFDTLRAGDRLYMIPTQDNELFLKNNIDFRKDIKASSDIRVRDLYLLNYLAVFILYQFFGGEGSNPQCREFITREELLENFTNHCKQVENIGLDDEASLSDFSENFVQLAQSWLQKVEGDSTSAKVTTDRNGVINKLLLKFKVEELFDENDGVIRPTRKMTDLIPYFLRKDRIEEIHAWLKGEELHATD